MTPLLLPAPDPTRWIFYVRRGQPIAVIEVDIQRLMDEARRIFEQRFKDNYPDYGQKE